MSTHRHDQAAAPAFLLRSSDDDRIVCPCGAQYPGEGGNDPANSFWPADGDQADAGGGRFDLVSWDADLENSSAAGPMMCDRCGRYTVAGDPAALAAGQLADLTADQQDVIRTDRYDTGWRLSLIAGQHSQWRITAGFTASAGCGHAGEILTVGGRHAIAELQVLEGLQTTIR